MPKAETIKVEPILRALNDRPEDELAFREDDNGSEAVAAVDDHLDLDVPVEERSPAAEAGLEAATRWRAANALVALREQVNARAPNRKKASDGTIGDERHCGHANATSDHCPRVLDGAVRVVCALDITHDPDNGCDAHAIAEQIRQSEDVRVKYIISNSRISNFKPTGGAKAWAWRPYSGSNPHKKHCHISVRPEAALFDNTTAWTIG